ncbi:MAG: hypothetical protein ABIH25_00210 [Candidatus Woesearchaeota archaeon]
MKKVAILLIICILMVSPIVHAQTYSNFEGFVDNVKLFFASGDKKVSLSSEIREKEVNSAIESTKKGDINKANQNLERAREKLQFIQEKVSLNTADEIKESVNNVVENIVVEENLPNTFDVYVMEEQKTQLIAELVIVVEGKEGQDKVRVVEGALGEINNEIKGWVVENTVAEGENSMDNGLTWEIKTDIDSGNYGGDDGLTTIVKEYIEGDGTLKIEDVKKVIEKGKNQIDSAPMTKDNEDVTPAPNIVDDDMCEEGEENCNNDDMAPGPQGIVGQVDDSNSNEENSENSGSENNDGEDSGGDSGEEITGEIVRTQKTSFLEQIFNFFFS